MVASTVWGHTSGDADAPQGLLRRWGRTFDVVETRRLLEECYQGAWDSLEAYAEELLEGSGDLDQVPQHLRSYIDVEAYARDLELGGDVFTVEEGCQVHVFLGG